ncbi:AAA family ATPase [Qipengyuania sp. S6317L1]|uniref:AAA family ATPase n=1 Tax=Qipengyuania sp. S6317L1 TaxID=2926410 RepID=UPI001FF485B6|nr:AAA family ATPase [Qipengyuania sp. S6317L1]MCK0098513.1 AAA family ATPase [Qipengyuania sp. S6317L1]
MQQESDNAVAELPERVSKSFAGQSYRLYAESFETTWGFRSTSGKYFKISNADLAAAFQDILTNWDEWTGKKLNQNSINPDVTLNDFSKSNFSEGAHKDLAEVQRRGFLHLINAVAYAARHDDPYTSSRWLHALTKEDYEKALEAIIELSEESSKISGSIGDAEPSPYNPDRMTGGSNVLFYGAPGTGKSYSVWNRIENKKHAKVTVFHADLQNSDFVGTLKPRSDGDAITYSFQPGPFAAATTMAWSQPSEKIFLVIEELNRAAAASVFGELFQLLDREDDGSSCYEVDFPSPEFRDWFNAETGLDHDKLSIPSNLWILATMNSADQGVFPLDTAFRRRWEQLYLPIRYEDDYGAVIKIHDGSTNLDLPWGEFVRGLNAILTDRLDIEEDRLVAPRFVGESELANGQLPGKLLIYLWDDLLRHGGREELFRSGIKTYGDLHAKVEKGAAIFSDGFLANLAEQAKAEGEASEVATTEA